VLLQEKKEKER